MNYYERIQNSIDFIELHLTEELKIERVAKEAAMSVATFYRMFLAIAGLTVKEYIRKRRLSEAAREIQNKLVIDVAMKYGYATSDAFSRAFKEEFLMSPSEYKIILDSSKKYFGRRNIVKEYFEILNSEITKEYPDVKVLKEMPDMKVACYKYFGEAPEDHAFAKIKEWLLQMDIHLNEKNTEGDSSYRIFGFNNPDPSNPENQKETYGYEVCVTINDEIFNSLEDAPAYGEKKSYDKVCRKILKGGKFAVVSVKRAKDGDLGYEIMKAWQRFSKWMEVSKYIWGGLQYLEEHLGFSDNDEHIGGVQLYMPVQEPRGIMADNLKEETIEKCRVAYCRVKGNDSEKSAFEVWNIMIEWARKNNLDSQRCRIFMYGSGFKKTPPYFHEIMISVPEDFVFSVATKDEIVKEKYFDGGKYMTLVTDNAHQYEMWGAMEQWRKETKTKPAKHQWVSEWKLSDWNFPEQSVKICYPIG